jgi:kinesin family protein 11
MERRTTASMAQSARAGTRTGGRASIRPGVRNTAGTATARHLAQAHARHASRIDRTTGAASPAESLASVATTATMAGGKRKERDYDGGDDDGMGGAGEATNINVVVRCRGRNGREVRENSAVVVAADAVKGTQVELSMGPSAVSNKTYQFDRVFSPAADQSMIFEDVVKPILDEVRG